MKTIDIVGENYCGAWKDTRTACRGVVLRDGEILLSYETVTDQWMLPGGGLESGEDGQACCVREVAEETGVLIQPSQCLLEIDEYYGDRKWINRYYFGEVTGKTNRCLTRREKEVGMEPGGCPWRRSWPYSPDTPPGRAETNPAGACTCGNIPPCASF